jgi:flagellar hook-associated protein 1 FlgK
MSSDLLSIARAGARTARTALDVTAQNIANASTAGYVRRSVDVSEVAAAGNAYNTTDVTLAGSRVAGTVRNADAFRQAEVRRTNADSARANAEVDGLENIESAIEQSGVFDSIVSFEGALQRLASDPVDPSLRAATVESARTMTAAFNTASGSLDAAGAGLRFEAQDGVDQVNTLSSELARINLKLVRTPDGSGGQATLLDQRDQLLEKLSGFADITTTIAADQTVEVRLGGASGPQLVNRGASASLAMSAAADGTIAFSVDGAPVTPTSGSLAGKGQALVKLNDIRASLDNVAKGIVTTLNAAQANGVALDGSAGQPLLGGTGAGDMKLVLDSGAMLATAPAGAGANSRDPGNLASLRTALTATDPAGAMNAVVFDISSAVSGRSVTRDALDTIASTARNSLQAQAGVDLDQEAVNLMRYQQAFQASGRVMQVASTIFDTILGIR